MACCEEHYDLYVKEVLDARSKNKAVDILPDRTDVSKEDTIKLYEKPVEEVLEETKEELKDYISDGESISDAINKINAEIDNKPKTRTRKKKTNK